MQYRRNNKKLTTYLAAFSLCLYLFSNGFVSYFLVHSLEDRYSLPDKLNGDVLVMLAGGATYNTQDIDGKGQLSGSAANRLLTTVRLQKQTNLSVILSGGIPNNANNESRIAYRQLISLGVPRNKIILDETSINTKENANNVKKIMTESGFNHPIVVTSAFHMERTFVSFKKLKVQITPFPTDYQVDTEPTFSFMSLAPSSAATFGIALALKEYLGLLALSISK